VDEAERSGFQVEWVCIASTVLIFIKAKGELGEQADCKQAFGNIMQNAGMRVRTGALHKVLVGTILLGSLVPSVAAYVRPIHSSPDVATNPVHCDIAMEIGWMKDMMAALEKTQAYFAENFRGPHGRFVKEVWNVLLPRARPPVREVAAAAPVLTSTIPFLGLEQIHAIAEEHPDAMILVFRSRGDQRYAPSMAVLGWDTEVAVPAGSLFPGEPLNCNAILHNTFYPGE
jgi:hypothetical protein